MRALGLGLGLAPSGTRWTPARLSSIVYWLRASDIVAAEGSALSSWPQKTGSGPTTQATGANQPTYKATAWTGGRAAVQWPGGAKFMTTPSLTLGPFTIAAACLVSADGEVFCHNSDASGGSYLYSTTGATVEVNRGGTISARNATSEWLSDGHPHSIIQSFDGTDAGHLLYKDGASVSLTDAIGNNPGTSTQAGVIYLGADQAGSLPMTGYLRELIVCNAVLSASDRAQLVAYMRSANGTP